MRGGSPDRLRALIVAAGSLLAACGSPGPDAGSPGGATPIKGHVVITEADSGRRFHISPRAQAVLRLAGEFPWEQPRVEGRSVELVRVDYFQDPGFFEWELQLARSGTSVISATCAPAAECPEEFRRFRVTVTVKG